MNTPTPAITRQELPPHFHQIKADEARFFAEVADITRLSYTEWLAGATELLREIRDGEVNAQDEADKFLRDHVPSELSKVTVQRDRLAEALRKCREDSVCEQVRMEKCGYTSAANESQANIDRADEALQSLTPEPSMNTQSTPETDAYAIKIKTPCGEKYWVPVDLSRRLERESDEAREGLAEEIKFHHRTHSELVQTQCQMQNVIRERDEARGQRDRLAEVIEAASVLIAAKGRHNTMLAYNGLRDALQSLTPNDMNTPTNSEALPLTL